VGGLREAPRGLKRTRRGAEMKASDREPTGPVTTADPV
jgi:hypothetical protein